MARQIKRRGDENKKIVDKAVRTALKRVERGNGNRAASPERTRVEFLHSGCTTLNLALSGRGSDGGWGRGRIGNIAGDGSSGKTLLALELAFRCWKKIHQQRSKIFKKVKKIIIVYNNCEGVMDFPLEKMYGKDFVNEVEWICDKEIEHMGRGYIRRLMALKDGHFMLYIIDSWDALYSQKDIKRIEKSIKEDKEQDGSYNLEKQKYASSFFNTISGLMENNQRDATLMIISQLRMRIGVTFGRKTYRTGGKALDFYTHQVAWVKEIEKLKRTRRGRSWTYGIRSEVSLDRSKVSKPFRSSEFVILYDYGIDDISSMIDFLWGKKSIEWKDEKWTDRKRFIDYIEENNLESELADYTEEVWQSVEKKFEDEVRQRKQRY